MENIDLQYNDFYIDINDVLTGLPAESIKDVYEVDKYSTLYTSNDGTTVFINFRDGGAYVASNRKYYIADNSEPGKISLGFN